MGTPETFEYTGAVQTWVVPAGKTEIKVECWGSQGGGSGGKGGYSVGYLSVTPSETLRIYVGGNAGFNGGGSGSGGSSAPGGGASDIRQGGSGLSNRKVIGGGGGSGSSSGPGGVGGGLVGGKGSQYYGGGGGTQSAGGAGVDGAYPGTLGVGGDGSSGGNGGGGGLYGGAGTISSGSGGGGGSSLISGLRDGHTDSGVREGNGKVVITWNVTPNAPSVNVPASIDRAQTNRISVPFSDDDTGDSQSKLDIRWWDLDGGGSRVGAVHTHSHSTPTQYWDAPGGTFTLGPKEIQGRSYDAQGEVSPWSASAFFTAGDAPPGPVIVAPTNGATIGQSYFVFQWSTPDQDAYETQLLDGNDAIVTALPVRDSSSGRSVSFGNIPNNTTRKARVRIRKYGIWSGWVTVTVTISYTAPAEPVVTTTPDPSNGALLVQFTNPAPSVGQPTVAYNDVFIDDRDGKGWVRKAAGLPTNSTWTYWVPYGGIDTGVKVVSTATNDTASEGVAP